MLADAIDPAAGHLFTDQRVIDLLYIIHRSELASRPLVALRTIFSVIL